VWTRRRGRDRSCGFRHEAEYPDLVFESARNVERVRTVVLRLRCKHHTDIDALRRWEIDVLDHGSRFRIQIDNRKRLLTTICRSIELNSVAAIHGDQKATCSAWPQRVRTANKIDGQSADSGLARREILHQRSGGRDGSSLT